MGHAAISFSGYVRGVAARIDARFVALLTAIGIYGLCGTPTPAAAGWPEIFIGLSLLLAAGATGAAQLVRPQPHGSWCAAAQGLALYGLTMPVTVGLLRGNATDLMLRDVIPFLFLLLPLFLAPSFPRGVRGRQVLTGVIALSGIAFAARVALPVLLPHYFAGPEDMPDPNYLANAATVLFAALLFIGLAGRQLYRGITPPHVIESVILAGAALLPLAAIAAVMQRAHAGAVIIFVGAGLTAALVRSPRRALAPILAAAIASLAIAAPAYHAALDLLAKNQAVGINERGQEALAVLRSLGEGPLGVIFGHGWGATVRDPAVGGLTVNFTHNFFTTYWLKTGLCGLGLAALYLWRLATLLRPIGARRPLLAAALALPLLIDITLYASFKSLDFGLLLLLIAIWSADIAPASPLRYESNGISV